MASHHDLKRKDDQFVICPVCSLAFPIDDIVAHVLTHSKTQPGTTESKPSGA